MIAQREKPSLQMTLTIQLNRWLQGYLDEQFNQLEDLQDEANPNFVEEVVTLFYSDSARFIHNIEQAM